MLTSYDSQIKYLRESFSEETHDLYELISTQSQSLSHLNQQYSYLHLSFLQLRQRACKDQKGFKRKLKEQDEVLDLVSHFPIIDIERNLLDAFSLEIRRNVQEIP